MSNKSGSMCPFSLKFPRIFSDSESVLPRLHRHLLSLQSTRITLPVHALVVTPGVLRNVTQMLRPRQRFQHLDGRNDMVIDLLSLLVVERTPGDRKILDFIIGEEIRRPF